MQLEDLNDLSPRMQKSLQYILDYINNDFEDKFNLTFEISIKNKDGNIESVELKPGGKDITVTKENR